MYITSATTDDIPACADLLAEVFSEDGVTRAFYPGDVDIEYHLRFHEEAMLRSHLPEAAVVDMAIDAETKDLLGVAFWIKPDAKPRLLKKIQALPLWWKALPSFSALPQIRKLSKKFDDAKPDAPHWALAEIGVSSAARGRGVGGALLRHRLERIDREHDAAYLEATSKEAAQLYGRHGFQPHITLDIDGIPCYTMLRPTKPYL